MCKYGRICIALKTTNWKTLCLIHDFLQASAAMITIATIGASRRIWTPRRLNVPCYQHVRRPRLPPTPGWPQADLKTVSRSRTRGEPAHRRVLSKLSSATVDARFLELLVILHPVHPIHIGPPVPRAAPSLHWMRRLVRMEYAEQPACTTGQSVRDALKRLFLNNALNSLETPAGTVHPLSSKSLEYVTFNMMTVH